MAISINELRQVPDDIIKTIDEQSSEVVFRAYINRSYYAIYHECKNYIETNLTQYDLSDDGTFKTGTHNRIYLTLEDLGKTNKEARRLALKFDYFLAKRHKADYKLDETITWYDVLECKKYFETIPNLLKEIS